MGLFRSSAVTGSLWLIFSGCSESESEPRESSVPDRPAPPVLRTAQGQLARTVIVPTPDTPVPEGKNAIWCLSFQLAWNELEKLAGGPIILENAGDLPDELNRAEGAAGDVPRGDVYARAGFARDGIGETIRREMAATFPRVEPPDPSSLSAAAVAFAYLRAGIRFPEPYSQLEKGTFTSSSQERAPASFFGIRMHDRDAGAVARRAQVGVLFHLSDEQYAVDLCKTSQPSQVILAAYPRRGSLGETWKAVEERIAAVKSAGGTKPLREGELLSVPDMNLLIEHRFRELEGTDKRFGNPPLRGLYLAEAFQMIRFSLDRSGVELESEARILAKAAPPRRFLFDRPFLLAMRKRAASRPFLLLWIDNAELLGRAGAGGA